MNEKEALIRAKTGNFNNGHGFDIQLLVDTVGIIGELFRNGQISEVVRCEDCKYGTEMSGNIICHKPRHNEYETDIRSFDWFCADGDRWGDR